MKERLYYLLDPNITDTTDVKKNYFLKIPQTRPEQVKNESPPNKLQWKLDLADTDLAETLDLKDTLQKIWATIFVFLVTRNSGKSRFSGQNFG